MMPAPAPAPARAPLLVAAALALTSSSCATNDAIRWEDADVQTTSVTVVDNEPAPPPPPPPRVEPPPAKAAEGTGAMKIDGRTVDDGGVLEMPNLELACLPTPEALTNPSAARARFEDTAGKQNLPIGRLTFVVLVRDPARSITDPPPRFCRAIPTNAAIKAPFFRAHEPARRWLFRRIAKSLVDDANALLAASTAQALTMADAPRVVVDEHGALVAVALPVLGDAAQPPGGT